MNQKPKDFKVEANHWLSQINSIKSHNEYSYLQFVRSLLIKNGIEPKIPKAWMLVFPIECKHDIPIGLEGRVKFSEHTNGQLLIYDANYMMNKYQNKDMEV